MKNIVLIGFMGSGKSSIAKSLSEKLTMQMIDTDVIAVKKSDRKSISEIFEKDGEMKFRDLEIKAAKSLSNKNNSIISTGGGVVMNKIIIDLLKTNGIIVFLKTSFPIIAKRLEGLKDRPLFKKTSEAKKLLELRTPLYETYADIVVSTDNKSVEQISDEIVRKVKQ